MIISEIEYLIQESLFVKNRESYLTSLAGYTNAKYEQFTNCASLVYSNILRLFNTFGLEYYLFAGSSVGYVRDGEPPPWLDDIDIILFDNQKEYFESVVVPHLTKCGYKLFRPHSFPNGGMHILALQLDIKDRKSTIPFSKDTCLTVPWAQIDVFYTTVDAEGFLKNLGGWGLYHSKKVPVSWVLPGHETYLFGQPVKIFKEFRRDIELEYGDVVNNIEVSSHGDVNLKLPNVKWSEFKEAFKSYTRKNILNLENFRRDKPLSRCKVITPEKNDGLLEILGKIQNVGCGIIDLTELHHFFWVPDIKKIFPDILVLATLKEPEHAPVVTQFSELYHLIKSENDYVSALVDHQIRHLNFTQP